MNSEHHGQREATDAGPDGENTGGYCDDAGGQTVEAIDEIDADGYANQPEDRDRPGEDAQIEPVAPSNNDRTDRPTGTAEKAGG
jgi:hypothetical protein